jgi:iron(III) transport system substrate-binding protein
MIVKATLAAALCALSATSFAQDFKADWARIVAAAEREGELILQSQPNQAARDFILREFPKAYPAIKVSLSVVPEAQFVARIRTERQAEKYLWDMAVAGASTGYALAKEGIVDPLVPELIDPNVNNPALWGGWDQAFMDLDKKYVLAMSSYIASPFYNAALISPEKVERLGFRVLLDPEYKGKIFWHDPTITGGGRNYGQPIRSRLGDDGLKKIVLEQAVLHAQQHLVVEGMARGTAWIGIGPPVRSLIAPYQQAGVKTELRAFGNHPDVSVQSIGGSGVYVFNRRPHPHATRVFVNWLLSRDTQHGMAKALDQRSRRQDVPETAEPDSIPLKDAKYFAPQREESIAVVEETMKFIADIRRTGK